MKTVLILILAVYMVLMIAIGRIASKKNTSAEDYLIAGGKAGTGLLAIAHQAAGLSGWLFLGFAGQVASLGLGGIWNALASAGAPITNFLILARRMRKFTIMNNAESVIDLIEARFYDQKQKIIRIISAVIILTCMVVYIGSQVMAAGKTFQVILGWDYNLSVILAAVVVVFYTSAGGLTAVIWTDFIQGMLMIFAIACGVWVSITHIGSPSEIIRQIGMFDSNLLNIAINPWTIIGLLASGYLAYLGQPQIIQMFMAMKNPEDSKKGAAIAGCTAFFLMFGGLIAMLGAILLTNNPADRETNFLFLAINYLPGWLTGLVCAGILAAVMSSADALLHVANTTVVQDIYNKIIRKGEATDKEIIKIGRVTGTIIGLLALFIALNPFEGVLWVIWWAWGGLTTFGPVVVLGLYWKYATREGAIAGLICGFTSSVVWFALGYYKFLHLSFVAFVCCMTAMIVVSLMTPKPPQEIIDQVASLKN